MICANRNSAVLPHSYAQTNLEGSVGCLRCEVVCSTSDIEGVPHGTFLHCGSEGTVGLKEARCRSEPDDVAPSSSKPGGSPTYAKCFLRSRNSR